MPDLVCFKDAEGRWIEANDTTLKVFQLEGVDYRGKTNTELAQLSPFLRDSFFEGEQTDEAMWSRGKVWSGEQVVPLRDGGAKTYETIKVPLYYADGQRRGIVILRRDMTERKQAEEEIRNALAKEKELSELQSRFVSIMSHEFRTPLTTVLSSAELIENYSYKWTEEKKLTHIHRIQNSVNHLVQLLEDVTIIGKAEAGKLEFKSEPIDLLQFCLHLVEEMELGAGSQHTIAFTSVGQCTNACMDEKLLRHIFTNLLSNAIKYSPQGGTVDFELACRDGQAIFQIKDSGLGIPKEDQEKLFESFYRAKNVGTISGTGLGLAIVKRSVDIHGGQITVESEVGVGTVFTVTLPLNSTELETRS
jgi:PAS domain S-box-containing protein